MVEVRAGSKNRISRSHICPNQESQLPHESHAPILSNERLSTPARRAPDDRELPWGEWLYHNPDRAPCPVPHAAGLGRENPEGTQELRANSTSGDDGHRGHGTEIL